MKTTQVIFTVVPQTVDHVVLHRAPDGVEVCAVRTPKPRPIVLTIVTAA